MFKLVRRSLIAAVFAIFCLGSAPSLWAQQSEWAVKMFSEMGGERVHDFGSVALHAQVEHRFQFKNVYREDVVISSVASNCGCTKASATKTTIRSGETAEIVARVDTSGREHTKSRKATITVLFAKPTFAEVQLQIKTYIRSDVGFDPGSIAFGTVSQGKRVVKKAYLQYEGSPNWALIGIQKSNPGIRAEAREVKRQGGSVVYEILVELKSDAQPGYLHDLLRFKTNDADVSKSSIFLPIDALVMEPLTAKPSTLQLGIVRPNQKLVKNLVVCGSTPFKITSVECSDPNVSFLKTNLSRTVHVVPVTFLAGAKVGPIERVIAISTDQPGQSRILVAASGYVVEGSERKESPAEREKGGTRDSGDDASASATPSTASGAERYADSVESPVVETSTVLSTDSDGAIEPLEEKSESSDAPAAGGWKAAPAARETPRRRSSEFLKLRPFKLGATEFDAAPSPVDVDETAVAFDFVLPKRVESTPSVVLASATIGRSSSASATSPELESEPNAPEILATIPFSAAKPRRVPIDRDALPTVVPGSSSSAKMKRI